MPAPVTTVVRPFAPSDARFVYMAAAEGFAEYAGATAAERTLATAQSPHAATLIVELAGRPAGFATVLVEDARAHLSAIVVAREFRGRGVGRQLLRAAERHAVARGARVMRLETGEANLAAIDLFVRAGYQRDGRVARYYQTGYDALQFRKALDAPAP